MGTEQPPFIVQPDDVPEQEGSYPPPFDAEKITIHRDLGRAAGSQRIGFARERTTKRAAIIVATVLLAAGAGGLAERAARADRMAPLPMALRIAVADQVIVGRVTAVAPFPGGASGKDGVATRAEVKTSRILKGVKEATFSIGFSEDIRHGTFHVAVGKEMVFLLSTPRTGESFWRITDHWDGAFDATAAGVAEASALATRRGAAWKDHAASGVRVMIVPEKEVYALGDDVTLFLVVQNRGSARVILRTVYWPRAEASFVALGLTLAGKEIRAKPVPGTEDARALAAHLEARGKWIRPLEAGRYEVLRLDRIGTAPAGYGYKEELGLVYLPIDKPGEYTVTARLERMIEGAPSIEGGTASFRVTK